MSPCDESGARREAGVCAELRGPRAGNCRDNDLERSAERVLETMAPGPHGAH